jgi:hypothetical protein
MLKMLKRSFKSLRKLSGGHRIFTTLQQQFARVVQDVERIREQQVASGRQIEGLCEGLMQRAFKGELVA